ncbi:MAG: hypothetical protein V4517_04540 [Pseudomonadota bacterium]
MAKKHTIGDLIDWSMRGRWADRFDEVLEDYLTPACEEVGLGIEDVAGIIGEDLFMSSVWACAFEDFLTREFDGENAIDDYLKRDGGKGAASDRTYIAALRNSTMSLYEVSDVVPGASFKARDLIRGGDPVLISERSATRSLKPWDRIAARVVQVGSKRQIGGGVLAFNLDTAEIVEALRRFVTPGNGAKPQPAESAPQDLDHPAFRGLSAAERLRAIGPILTGFWLVDAIERAKTPKIPELRNADGDELLLFEMRYPLAPGVKAGAVRAVLKAHKEFRPAGKASWNWISQQKPAPASRPGKRAKKGLIFETWLDDGALALGHIELEKRGLILFVNSRERADRGDALLSGILGQRVGKPGVRAETIEEMMASRSAAEPQGPDIPEEERRAIVHEHMEAHYRRVLDEPVPALGGETPRGAVKTASGRLKVAEWLKLIENKNAMSGTVDSAMASYDFIWLWAELGISDLRR